MENFRACTQKWPPITVALIVGMVLIHLSATALAPDLDSFFNSPYTLAPFYPEWENALMIFGARSAPEILDGGQYYRMLSCVFLHGDGMHLTLNMVALFGLGRLCEAIYGKGRFLWLVRWPHWAGRSADARRNPR